MKPPAKWTNLPLPETGSVSVDVTDWGWLYQFWLAIRDRLQPFCGRYFPSPTKIWDGGIISTLSNTDLTDSTRIPYDDGTAAPDIHNGAPSWHCNDGSLEPALVPEWYCCCNFGDPFEFGQDEWIDRCAVDPDFPGECNPAVPRDYEVVIGADLFTEPYKIKVSRIRSNGMYTLRFDDLGLEASELAALVGKRYEIVRLGGGDLFWHKHIPYANSGTIWRGSGDVTANPTTFTITDNTADGPWRTLWRKDQFKRKTVAVHSSVRGGYPRYGKIVTNDEHSFTFTLPNGYVPDGAYAIMRDATPDHYSFDLKDDTPWAWETQYPTGFWSTDSNINAAPNFQFPKTSIEVGNENCDGTVSKPLMDNDFRTDFDQDPDCSGISEFPADIPDNIISPDIFKSWRGLQAWVEQNCVSWVPTETYDNGKAFHNYVAAYLFFKAGINSHTDTAHVHVDDLDNLYVSPINHGVPEAIPVYYAVEYRNDWVASGVFWCSNGQNTIPVDAHPLNCDGITYKYEGARVYISYGWTRRVGRHFRFMYDRPYFDPDTAEGGGALPPGPDSPGQWSVRSKSSTYAKSNDNFLPDNNFDSDAADIPGTFADVLIGHTEDSTELFKTNELAHYFGDNWQGTTTEWSTDSVSQSYADVIIKGQFEGQTPIDLGHHVAGNATAVGQGWIRDDEQNWELFGEWDGFTGTATGGSNTSLQCSTVYGPDPDYEGTGTPPNIFLDQRWQTSTGRWVGFIVEILSGPFGGQKAVITGFNESAHEISFSLPNFTEVVNGSPVTHSFNWQYSDSGGNHAVQFKIHESKHKDRWAGGRQLQITDVATGTKYVGTIDHSDNNTIWFSGISYQPRKGDAYRIIEAQVGYVYKWDGSKWVSVPHGNAAEPTVVTRYGRANKCDYWQALNINELYRCIDALRWTKGGYSWTANGELNEKISQIDFDDGYDPNSHSSAENLTYFEGLFAANSVSVDASPFMEGDVSYDINEGQNNDHLLYNFGARYAYGKLTKCGMISCAVDWYAWSEFLDSIETFGSINDFITVQANLPDGSFDGVPPGHISSTGCVGNWDQDFEVDYYQLHSESTPGDDIEDTTIDYSYTSDGHAIGNGEIFDGFCTTLYESTFDANGQTVSFRSWKKWTTTDASSATTLITTEKLGSISQPAIDSPAYTDNPQMWRGFIVQNQEAILRWDVPGGLSFVS